MRATGGAEDPIKFVVEVDPTVLESKGERATRTARGKRADRWTPVGWAEGKERWVRWRPVSGGQRSGCAPRGGEESRAGGGAWFGATRTAAAGPQCTHDRGGATGAEGRVRAGLGGHQGLREGAARSGFGASRGACGGGRGSAVIAPELVAGRGWAMGGRGWTADGDKGGRIGSAIGIRRPPSSRL